LFFMGAHLGAGRFFFISIISPHFQSFSHQPYTFSLEY